MTRSSSLRRAVYKFKKPSLIKTPLVRAALQQLWECAIAITPATVATISKKDYCVMWRKISLLLNGPAKYTDEQLTALVDLEWEDDVRGEEVLTHDLFFRAWFMLADAWSETCEVTEVEMAKFLNEIYDCIVSAGRFIPDGEIDQTECTSRCHDLIVHRLRSVLQSVSAFEQSGRDFKRTARRKQVRKVKATIGGAIAFGGRFDPNSKRYAIIEQPHHDCAFGGHFDEMAFQRDRAAHDALRLAAEERAREEEQCRRDALAELRNTATREGRPISSAFDTVLSEPPPGTAEWEWEGDGVPLSVDSNGMYVGIKAWNEGVHPRLIGGRPSAAGPTTSAPSPTMIPAGVVGAPGRVSVVAAREFILDSPVDLSSLVIMSASPTPSPSVSPTRSRSPTRRALPSSPPSLSPLASSTKRSIMTFCSSPLRRAECPTTGSRFMGVAFLDPSYPNTNMSASAAEEASEGSERPERSTVPLNIIPACSPSSVLRGAGAEKKAQHWAPSVSRAPPSPQSLSASQAESHPGRVLHSRAYTYVAREEVQHLESGHAPNDGRPRTVDVQYGTWLTSPRRGGRRGGAMASEHRDAPEVNFSAAETFGRSSEEEVATRGRRGGGAPSNGSGSGDRQQHASRQKELQLGVDSSPASRISHSRGSRPGSAPRPWSATSKEANSPHSSKASPFSLTFDENGALSTTGFGSSAASSSGTVIFASEFAAGSVAPKDKSTSLEQREASERLSSTGAAPQSRRARKPRLKTAPADSRRRGPKTVTMTMHDRTQTDRNEVLLDTLYDSLPNPLPTSRRMHRARMEREDLVSPHVSSRASANSAQRAASRTGSRAQERPARRCTMNDSAHESLLEAVRRSIRPGDVDRIAGASSVQLEHFLPESSAERARRARSSIIFGDALRTMDELRGVGGAAEAGQKQAKKTKQQQLQQPAGASQVRIRVPKEAKGARRGVALRTLKPGAPVSRDADSIEIDGWEGAP